MVLANQGDEENSQWLRSVSLAWAKRVRPWWSLDESQSSEVVFLLNEVSRIKGKNLYKSCEARAAGATLLDGAWPAKRCSQPARKWCLSPQWLPLASVLCWFPPPLRGLQGPPSLNFLSLAEQQRIRIRNCWVSHLAKERDILSKRCLNQEFSFQISFQRVEFKGATSPERHVRY